MTASLTDAQILACNNTAAEDQEFNPCITAPDDDLIAFARQVLRVAAPSPAADAGEVVVTKTEAGQIVAVTRQDEEGRILKVIAQSPPAADALPAAPAPMTVPAHTGGPGRIYVTCHQCDMCQHIGINDEHATEAACNRSSCAWHGPSPAEDRCPGCGDTGTMSTACPECGGHYVLLADADVAPALPAASEPASGARKEQP